MTGELGEAQSGRIFETDIRPELDELGTSSCSEFTPSLVFVGGQPGAGKSKAVARAVTRHPGIIEVVGDDLRIYHPDYRRLMYEAPSEMPRATAQASGRWVGMALDHLREQRMSTVVETTLRQLPVVQETATQFRRAGYRIELHVVAVPKEVSRLGTISRYINQARQDGAGRWTPAAAHDVAAAAVPYTAAELVRAGCVDHISIQNRQGTPYFQATPRPDRRPDIAAAVVRTIDGARNPELLSVTEARQWFDTAIADVRTCVRTGQTDPDLLATVDTVVSTDAPRLAAAAFPGDAQAQRKVLSELREAHHRT